MRSETSTIIINNYPGELITFLNLNLPPAFKGAVGRLLLLFLSTCSHLKCSKLTADFFIIKTFPQFLKTNVLNIYLHFIWLLNLQKVLQVYRVSSHKVQFLNLNTKTKLAKNIEMTQCGTVSMCFESSDW